MHDAWTERLSEHVDGTLTSEEGTLLEAHLATCPSCASTLEGLRGVVARARALPDAAPASDLWPGIEVRIAASAREADPRRDRAPVRSVFPAPRRGLVVAWPQLVAAGVAIALLSGAVTWSLLRGARPNAPAVAGLPGRESEGPGRSDATSTGALGHELAGELDQLERVLAEKRGELDPGTVQTIEANLKIIDLATTQARAALASDPANPYLREHLAKTMRQKIEMLREATLLASAP